MSLVAIVLAFLVPTHPLHLSVTEIEMRNDKKELHVVMHVFADDLEVAIRDHQKNPLIDLTRSGTAADTLVGNYLSSRFRVMLDGKERRWAYLGNEIEGDAFYFYILVENVQSWNTIYVRNTILTETFNDQSNIVNVKHGGEQKSLRLTKKVPSGSLTFD